MGRGTGRLFGADALHEFLQRFDLDLVVRGHEVVEDGYKFFANRQLVTVFSAPNYCGQYNNAAAVVHVREDLLLSFSIFSGAPVRHDV